MVRELECSFPVSEANKPPKSSALKHKRTPGASKGEPSELAPAVRGDDPLSTHFYHATPAMLHALDGESRLLAVSDQWLANFGYEREEVIGRHWPDFLSPESKRYAEEEVLPAFFRDGSLINVGYEAVRKDGSNFNIELSAVLHRDEDSDSVASLAVIQDVTQRVHAERDLAINNERLQSIMEGTRAGTWEWNVQTGETRFNERWAEIIGFTLAELSPTTIDTWAAHAHAGDLEASSAVIEQVLSGELDYYDVEVRMRHRDGHMVWVHDRGHVASYDDKGAPLWLMGTHTDITARKEAEERLFESNRSFERTGSIANVGGWHFDLRNDVLTWSEQTYRIHDLDDATELNVELGLSFYTDESREQVSAAMAAAVSDRKPWDLELEISTAKGRMIWVRVSGEPELEDGEVVRLVGAIQDITWKHETEREAAESRELLQVTLKSIGEGVITTDLAGRVAWMNPQAEKMCGWSFEAAQNRLITDVCDLFDEESGLRASDPTSLCIAEGAVQVSEGYHLMRALQGPLRAIEYSASPITDDHGDIFGAVLIIRDVSEQRDMSREMRYRATHDGLTGLVNRSEFETRLTRLLEGVHQSEDANNALMYIDLDEFKIVNDSCGHAEGDRLLRQIAQIFAGSIRARDTLARLGGDEFGVILEHCTVQQAQRVAQSICDAVDEYRFDHDGRRFRVGASIGLVPISASAENADAILKAADNACYAAKEAGRNRVHLWRDEDERIQMRQGQMAWTNRIENALDDDRFVLFGQQIRPIDRARRGGHCEVLLRMVDTDGELVPPGAFLPAAERYHLAQRVDRWVVNAVFAWIREHAAEMQHLETLAINLSGQSISDHNFHQFLYTALENASFDVSKLCFEITETAVITRLEEAARFVERLNSLGVRTALDDFGAGASSFGYLKQLPVDYLKIDGQFVRDVIDDDLDLVAIRSFVDVARVVGIDTIAEFVESEEILIRLAELGVDFAQGYLIHKPEPLDQIYWEEALPYSRPSIRRVAGE